MSAEDLGRRLLGEVEELALGEVLQSLQVANDPEPSSRLGILPLDRLLHLLEQSSVPTQRQDHPQTEPGSSSPKRLAPAAQGQRGGPKAPVVELTSIGPCAGKTHLLYWITAIAILPKSHAGLALEGKQSAVIVFDTDDRFDVERLAQVMRHHVGVCAQQQHQQSPDENPIQIPDEADLTELLESSLTHVHILRPQSQTALLSSVASLPAYLFDQTAHHSSHRPVHSIILDSASAFYWPVKAQEESSRLPQGPVSETQEKHAQAPASATASESYSALVRSLRKLQKDLSCAIIATSASMPYTNSQAFVPTLRPLLPPSWTLFVTLRLAVARAVVPPFAPTMSVEEALRERAERQSVVEKCVFGARVDGWGSDMWGARVRDGLRRVEGGGRFEFVVGDEGVWVKGKDSLS